MQLRVKQTCLSSIISSVKNNRNKLWKSVWQHKWFQKPPLLSRSVHPFLLLNLYLPRYSYLSLVFRAVIFMFHPFSDIFHSWKFNLVPRNFPLENGRKSPGNEIGGVWEIRELKQRRRQRELQKAIGSDNKTTNMHLHHPFLYIYLPSLHVTT